MSKIKVAALGGIGENGKNMFVVEVDNRIFVLDAGLKYPEVDLYGVDAIIPNMDYLIENRNRIEGVFLSHAHEDHIGALPFLLQKIHTRVYGSNFTITLLENLISQSNIDIRKTKLYRINTNKKYTFGNVNVAFFGTTHSIPESCGIVIETEDGSIVFAPDFNFHLPPTPAYQTEFDKITALSNSNVLLAMTESIGISEVDRSNNDIMFEHIINSCLNTATGKVFIGICATDLSRIQKVVDVASAQGYKVILHFPTRDKILNVALKNKYITIPESSYVDYKTFNQSAHQKIVIILSGVGLQPYRSVTKILNGQSKQFTMEKNDQVMFVSDPIPGTTKEALQTLDLLARHDIKTIRVENKMLRTSHATAEDLLMFYQMIKPKYIMPIVGEYRHLQRHYDLIEKQTAVNSEVLKLDNGKVIVFENGSVSESEVIETGSFLVDGSLMDSVNDKVVEERNTLAEEGAVFILININQRTRMLINNPVVYMKGCVLGGNVDEYKKNVSEMALKHATNALKKGKFEQAYLQNLLETEVGRMTYRIYKRRPVIIPIINEMIQ